MNWFEVTTDDAYRKRERAKAQELKKTSWWHQKLSQGICHYCEGKFESKDLTMDHVVPLARGGKSTKGNLVPSCKDCNAKKRMATPVDMILGS